VEYVVTETCDLWLFHAVRECCVVRIFFPQHCWNTSASVVTERWKIMTWTVGEFLDEWNHKSVCVCLDVSVCLHMCKPMMCVCVILWEGWIKLHNKKSLFLMYVYTFTRIKLYIKRNLFLISIYSKTNCTHAHTHTLTDLLQHCLPNTISFQRIYAASLQPVQVALFSYLPVFMSK
jgi:hypothetical protein